MKESGPASELLSWRRGHENLPNRLNLLGSETTWEGDFDSKVEIAEAGGVVSERHAFALQFDHLKGARDALGAKLNDVAIQMLDGLGPSQKSFPQRDLCLYVKIVTATLEATVLFRPLGGE